jgi:hypothetical protein
MHGRNRFVRRPPQAGARQTNEGQSDTGESGA